jgi:hypothetical protein
LYLRQAQAHQSRFAEPNILTLRAEERAGQLAEVRFMSNQAYAGSFRALLKVGKRVLHNHTGPQKILEANDIRQIKFACEDPGCLLSPEQGTGKYDSRNKRTTPAKFSDRSDLFLPS